MATEHAQLDTLEAKGLIRLANYRPELEYLFRHWLVQDAAYGSLLKQERRELHRRVGEALELLYPERQVELAAVLALHFEQAGDTEKALGYLLAAGQYALDRSAIREAYSAFERARVLLPPTTDGEDDRIRNARIMVELGRARAGMTFRPADDLVADLEVVLPDAERLGDLSLIAPIHLALALGRLQSGVQASDPVVKRSLDRVAEIGEELGDPSLRAMPLALVGLTQVFMGPLRDGVAALEEAVPLLQQTHDSIGAAFARGALAIGYAQLGEFEKAEQASRSATELAASGDQIAQLDALIAEAMLRSELGQLDKAGPLALACVNRAEEVGATACVMPSSWILGDVYHRQGRFADARAVLERGNEISLADDRNFWRPTLTAWLGSAASALGDAAAAEGNWDEALATARSIGNRFGEAGILRKRAEARAASGNQGEALADFASSAAELEAEGARPGLARLLRGWGEALRATGRGDEANEKLRRSRALFKELGLHAEGQRVGELLDDTAAEQAPE